MAIIDRSTDSSFYSLISILDMACAVAMVMAVWLSYPADMRASANSLAIAYR